MKTTASQLHVVVAYSNPLRWRSRPRLYRQFEHHMLHSGVQLHTVELAHGHRHFEISTGHDASPDVDYIQVRCRDGANGFCWHKESLLNVGLRHIPRHVRYIGIADADVAFDRRDWALETIEALQSHPIVQPWSDALDLGARGEVLKHHRSFGALWVSGELLQKAATGRYDDLGHPGFFWAATREFLADVGGLIDRAVLGSADRHMAMACIGRGDKSFNPRVTNAYKAMVMGWQARALAAGGVHLGVVPHSTIRHFFHGHKDLRRYVDRWQILVKHQYDPVRDVILNLDGVIELAGNKHHLARDIHKYFRDRSEDDSVIL